MSSDCCCSPNGSWEAECDARTMVECVAIMKDTKRKDAAMVAMKKMQKEEEDEKQAMADLVSGKIDLSC